MKALLRTPTLEPAALTEASPGNKSDLQFFYLCLRGVRIGAARCAVPRLRLTASFGGQPVLPPGVEDFTFYLISYSSLYHILSYLIS